MLMVSGHGNQDVILVTLSIILDMRKAMPRDVDKLSIIPLQHPVTLDELE